MQNKIIILIVIILNLSILNAQSNDQITFDVSELEILDGGNKIIEKIEELLPLIIICPSWLIDLNMTKVRMFLKQMVM